MALSVDGALTLVEVTGGGLGCVMASIDGGTVAWFSLIFNPFFTVFSIPLFRQRPSVLPSFRPTFRPSVLPSPLWPSEPQVCSLRPYFGPLSPQISPFRPQFSPEEPKSALHTSYLPSRPKIRPPDLKPALQVLNQLFRPKIFPPGLKPAPQASILLFWT